MHTSVTHLHEQRQAWRKYIDKSGLFFERVVTLFEKRKESFERFKIKQNKYEISIQHIIYYGHDMRRHGGCCWRNKYVARSSDEWSEAK